MARMLWLKWILKFLEKSGILRLSLLVEVFGIWLSCVRNTEMAFGANAKEQQGCGCHMERSTSPNYIGTKLPESAAVK